MTPYPGSGQALGNGPEGGITGFAVPQKTLDAIERCSGQLYCVGEATRLISDHEDLFWAGQRADTLAASEQIGFPNLLVLKKGDERLVLLFNESAKPVTVTLRNKGVKTGQKATVYYAGGPDASPKEMTVTIPAQDVEAVYIK